MLRWKIITERKRVGISVHVLSDVWHRFSHLKWRYATAMLDDLCKWIINKCIRALINSLLRFHSRKPLNTSPSASTSVFPCSFVMFFAISDMLARIICWRRSMTCWRVRIEVWLHVLNARFDESTAACISSWVHLGTRVTSSLVAGSFSSIHSVVVESTNFPSMNIFIVGATFDVL